MKTIGLVSVLLFTGCSLLDVEDGKSTLDVALEAAAPSAVEIGVDKLGKLQSGENPGWSTGDTMKVTGGVIAGLLAGLAEYLRRRRKAKTEA